ncbi:MAG: helix-turn-helix domain-containing protein [Sporichthyaceae bacterium]
MTESVPVLGDASTEDPRLLALATSGEAPEGIDCTELHKLALLSMLMADRGEAEIVRLAVAACPGMAPDVRTFFHLPPTGWWPEQPEDLTAADLAEIEGPGVLLRDTPDGPVYLIAVRCFGLRLGHLVVLATKDLTERQLFPLQVLAQQLAVALDNARRHAREQAMVAELEERHVAEAAMVAQLEALNSRLDVKVEELRTLLETHSRLAQVAGRGGGIAGIVGAVAELSGRPARVEDETGAVLACSGGRTAPPPSSAAAQARLFERLRREPRPVREGTDLVALAGHRVESAVVLRLFDPDALATEHEVAMLEHAATIVAMELARSATVAEAELRLRRDLIEELLLGMPEEAARVRADALGVDLDRPRRVAVIRRCYPAPAGTVDALLPVIRRVLRRLGEDCLPVARGEEVLCLAGADVDWSAALDLVREEQTGGPCRIGVGSRCVQVADYPVSLRHARHSVALGEQSQPDGAVVRFDDLGVYRLLALNNDTAELAHYIEEWLGVLIAYDAAKSADLVQTLTIYLRTGGSITTTAEELTIHRSTVKYRLQRVEELTGRDLNDPAVQFGMQLAVHALRTREGLRA